MLSVREFCEKIKNLDNKDAKAEILKYCTEFSSILGKKEYTEEDRELIKKFVTEGLYEKLVNENIRDTEIRAKIIDIRNQYKTNLPKKDSELGKIYKENKMFSIIRNSIENALSTDVISENFDEHLKLFNEYVCKMIDPISSNFVLNETRRITQHISLEEFQQTAFHNKMIKTIKTEKDGNIDEKRRDTINRYTLDYIELLIINDREIDFENDDFLKIFDAKEKEELKQSARIRTILLKEDANDVENKDLLIMLDTIKKTAQNGFYSDIEKKFLRNYIEKGFFEKTIRTNFNDKDVIESLISLRIKYQENIIGKDKKSFSIYTENDIYKMICEECVSNYGSLDNENEISLKEIDMINEIVQRIVNNSFKKHKFEAYEKNFIDMYFDKFFEKSVQYVDKSDTIEKTLKTLVKTQKYSVYNAKNILDKHKNKINNISNLLRNKILPENSQEIDLDKYDRILELTAYQNLKNIDLLKIGIGELQKRGIENVYNTSSVKEYIEHFIKFYSPEGNFQKFPQNKDEVFSFIFEYVDSLTQKNDFNIFNSQGISDILQLIASDRLPEECSKKITQILNKNLKIDEIDKEEAIRKATTFCEERVIEQPDKSKKVEAITDEAEFDEFLKNVQQIKLTNNLRVSDKIVNFIILQTFDENSVIRKNPQKYQPVIERTLEDIAFNDICTSMSQVNKRKRCFFIRENLTSSSSDNANGINSKYGYAMFSRKLVKNLLENRDLKVFETIFHENVHTEQKYESSKKNSYIKYLIKKESALRDENPEFYKANYETMYCEIEARTEGARKLAHFIENIGLDLTQEYHILEELIKGDILNACRERAKKEEKEYAIATEKVEKIGNTEKVKVTEYFDRMMIKNPEKILEKYPELKMEYNTDGTLKTPLQFLMDAPPEMGRKTLFLYRNVLSKGNIFKPENLERDLEDLMELAKKGQIDKNLMAFSVLDNVGRMIDKIATQVEEMPLEQLFSMQDIFDKTNKFIESNEGNPFSVALQKHLRGKGMSAYEKMNQMNQNILKRIQECSKEEIIAVRKKLFGGKEESFEKEKLETIHVVDKVPVSETSVQENIEQDDEER